MTKSIIIWLASAFAVLGAACSNAGERSTNANTASPSTNVNSNTASAGGGHTSTAKDDVPAGVRAALTDAQTITTDHKDVPAPQIAEIERETGTKINDPDHHTYLGFSTSGGTRKQTGAATIVEAAGKQMILVYESRNGLPYIKEVIAEGMPQAFLDQFKGKGHDDKLRINQDLKTHGIDETTARAAADAVRRDTRIMQALYGGSHSH